MSDTVFIFGAGFSHDAGIPLLSGFVDRMWEYAIREKTSKDKLNPEDVKIFQDAMRIRKNLDGYHGRALFNDRNIEDILSILSFKNHNNSDSGDWLDVMSKAIARTIELSSSVSHPGITGGVAKLHSSGPAVYRNLWSAIINQVNKNKKVPTIITFNYDLVLESALFQHLIGNSYSFAQRLPFEKLRLNYEYEYHLGAQYDVEYVDSLIEAEPVDRARGTILKETRINKDENKVLEINYLKLHGSLNFPVRREKTKKNVLFTAANLTKSIETPLILPPVFNKLSGNTLRSLWDKALEKLGKAKNIVIVGYSLPQTDIYLQYFLKAAIGPNTDLNKIYVFDPVLFSDTPANVAMRARYESCFSPQIRNRIIFNPTSNKSVIEKGTTAHFVDLLENSETELIF